jgi:hypothetical protein
LVGDFIGLFVGTLAVIKRHKMFENVHKLINNDIFLKNILSKTLLPAHALCWTRIPRTPPHREFDTGQAAREGLKALFAVLQQYGLVYWHPANFGPAIYGKTGFLDTSTVTW